MTLFVSKRFQPDSSTSLVTMAYGNLDGTGSAEMCFLYKSCFMPFRPSSASCPVMTSFPHKVSDCLRNSSSEK